MNFLQHLVDVQWMTFLSTHFLFLIIDCKTRFHCTSWSVDVLYSTVYTFIDIWRAIPATKLLATSSYKLGFYRYGWGSRTFRNITIDSIYIYIQGWLSMTHLLLDHSWRSHYTSFLLCCNITRGLTWFRHDSTKIHPLLHHSIRSNHNVKSQASQHKTASGANIYWDTCGSPVIKCLCFLSSFVFLRHKMEKLRNSTQWSLGPQHHDN